jgi:ribosome-associated protein
MVMEYQFSRSEKKRRAKNIEQLVYELATLPDNEITALPCDEEIIAEIRTARNLKGGARKLQLKYATKLLRDIPVGELFDYLAEKKGSILKQNREFHHLEHMRDMLIKETVQQYDQWMQNEGFINDGEPFIFSWHSEALQYIVEQLPDIDQELMKNAAMQFARTRNRKFSRELFRTLKAALEKQQYSNTRDRDNGI